MEITFKEKKVLNGKICRLYPDTLKDRENLHYVFPEAMRNKMYITEPEYDELLRKEHPITGDGITLNVLINEEEVW